MKKYILYITASLFMIAGCAKINAPEATGNETITVIMPEVMTKMAFGAENEGKLPLIWNTGDKIAVAQGLGTASEKVATYVLEGEGGTASGQFKYNNSI